MLLLSLRVRGEGEVGEVVGWMEGFEGEKAVRSFWRERDGERRVEGMIWCWMSCVERDEYGICSSDMSLYVLCSDSCVV